jgi:hypothetical protein
MITETGFPVGLARVKAKALSGSGRISQVRSGYSSGNWVKAFSLSGSDQVSWVTSVKAKTSPRAGFSLIPRPGLG